VWFFRASIVFAEINKLLPMPHICVRSLELHAGCRVIVAVLLSTNYHHESCIWHLWDVTSQCVTRALSLIRHRLLVSSPSVLPHLPNPTCTCLQKHLHPLPPNTYGIIEIFQRQPGLESLQKICNRHLAAQRSISQLFHTVLSQDNRSMLLLEKPSHRYFLPLVEDTKVGLPHPFGKLLQGEFRFLQASVSCSFSPAQVRRIIALTICIKFVI
jgi:hypothetical protein